MTVVHVEQLSRLLADPADCGAADNPCFTIQGGIDKAAAGDTVLVKPSLDGGAYDGAAIVGKSLTLQAQEGESVLIEGHAGVGLTVRDAGNVTIDGFTISRSSPGIDASNVDELMISNVTANDNFRDGLIASGGKVTIEDSEFSRNDDGVVLLSDATASLTRVKTNDNDGKGVWLSYTKNVTLTDVEAKENGDGVSVDQNASSVRGDISIVGGTFEDNRSNGVRARYLRESSVTISGGSFRNNGSDGVRLDDVSDVRIQKRDGEIPIFESNGDDGLSVTRGGNVSIDGGHYKLNPDKGILLRDVKKVNIDNVLSTENNIGARIDGTECRAFIGDSTSFLGNRHENVTEDTYTDPIESDYGQGECALIPPPASNTYVTPEDVEFRGRVMATDVDGDELTIRITRQPAHGNIVEWNDDGTFVYRPTSNYHGTDSFEYSASDGQATTTGRVSITITPVNDAPVAVDDNEVVDEDNVLRGDVSGNDLDADGPDDLTYELITPPRNGTLVFRANGTFVYTPNADYNGNDHFEYRLSDGQESDTARVNIRVNPVNDPPVCGPDNAEDCSAGDANFDGVFNSLDLIALFTAGKYERDEPATFAEGDFNNDGRFDSADLIKALSEGHYQD